MEKDNKVLLGAVLILLVAMVSFNFNSITGQVAAGGVTVSATPTRITFQPDVVEETSSRVIDVTVKVNSGKIDNKLELYRVTASGGEERLGGRGTTICSKSQCKKGTYNLKFRMDSSLGEGQYFFKAQRRDYASTEREEFNSNTVTLVQEQQPFRGDLN